MGPCAGLAEQHHRVLCQPGRAAAWGPVLARQKGSLKVLCSQAQRQQEVVLPDTNRVQISPTLTKILAAKPLGSDKKPRISWAIRKQNVSKELHLIRN